jgi:RNA polymerase sigma-70 factor (ECF subfamily)
MPASELHTTQLHVLIDRIQSGDRPARDEFVRRVGERMERLARKMLRQFENVRSWEETGDVLQKVLMSVLHALESGSRRPESVREFYAYAATCIRNALLDLARHYRGVRAPDVRPLGGCQTSSGESPGFAADLTAGEGADDLQRWYDFHEAVGRLPEMEREVVGLKFYHGMTNQEIGDVFQISEKMVRKHWLSACVKLNEMLQGDLPAP